MPCDGSVGSKHPADVHSSLSAVLFAQLHGSNCVSFSAVSTYVHSQMSNILLCMKQAFLLKVCMPCREVPIAWC